MVGNETDTLIRLAAFEHVRRLSETHDHLTTAELKGSRRLSDTVFLSNIRVRD